MKLADAAVVGERDAHGCAGEQRHGLRRRGSRRCVTGVRLKDVVAGWELYDEASVGAGADRGCDVTVGINDGDLGFEGAVGAGAVRAFDGASGTDLDVAVDSALRAVGRRGASWERGGSRGLAAGSARGERWDRRDLDG